jgi:cytochrome c553
LPPLASRPHAVTGSTLLFTPEQIDDPRNPPDWFPRDHGPVPAAVGQGRTAPACASCHLMSGAGRPESADISGLTSAYMLQQIADFRSGARPDAGGMAAVAAAVTDDALREAVDWFAALPRTPTRWVSEQTSIPRTVVVQDRLRVVHSSGDSEPIGTRIISVPRDLMSARLRDPRAVFITYVPRGSVEQGRALVDAGGCAACHGERLTGAADVPRLASQHPLYLARQLYALRDGSRRGPAARGVRHDVATWTDEAVVGIAAFLATLRSI